MSHVYGTTLYFDATVGPDASELWAYGTTNGSLWQVTEIYDPASMTAIEAGIGAYISVQIGHTLYISADDGHTGNELWAHDLLHGHTWQVADIHQSNSSKPGWTLSLVIGDTLYFSADDGEAGNELWAHSTATGHTWMVLDAYSGANSSSPGAYFELVVGDALYFSARDEATGVEIWRMAMEHTILYG